MAMCSGKIIHSDSQLMSKLKCKSWDEFAKGKETFPFTTKKRLVLYLTQPKESLTVHTVLISEATKKFLRKTSVMRNWEL